MLRATAVLRDFNYTMVALDAKGSPKDPVGGSVAQVIAYLAPEGEGISLHAKTDSRIARDTGVRCFFGVPFRHEEDTITQFSPTIGATTRPEDFCLSNR